MRVLGLMAIVMVSCTPQWETEEVVDGLRLLTATHTSNSTGTIKARVDIESGESAMILTAEPTTTNAFTSRIIYEGDVLFDSSEIWESEFSHSNGAFSSQVVTFNWPLDSDTTLLPGTYVFELKTPERQVVTPLSLAVKSDDDLTGGELKINMVYIGGTDDDPGIVAAVDGAVEIWRILYTKLGIDLQVTSESREGQSIVSAPGEEDAELYEEISAGSSLRTIDVVIAWDVQFIQPIYGVSGDIPGPLVASGKSVIATSMLYGAGPDGNFSDEETRILAETLAHETLHYTGLFHPVEVTYDHWDNLTDTPNCTTQADCITNLADNLMFPFPVCGLTTCLAQTEISSDQINVSNAYTGVD